MPVRLRRLRARVLKKHEEKIADATQKATEAKTMHDKKKAELDLVLRQKVPDLNRARTILRDVMHYKQAEKLEQIKIVDSRETMRLIDSTKDIDSLKDLDSETTTLLTHVYNATGSTNSKLNDAKIGMFREKIQKTLEDKQKGATTVTDDALDSEIKSMMQAMSQKRPLSIPMPYGDTGDTDHETMETDDMSSSSDQPLLDYAGEPVEGGNSRITSGSKFIQNQKLRYL